MNIDVLFYCLKGCGQNTVLLFFFWGKQCNSQVLSSSMYMYWCLFCFLSISVGARRIAQMSTTLKPLGELLSQLIKLGIRISAYFKVSNTHIILSCSCLLINSFFLFSKPNHSCISSSSLILSPLDMDTLMSASISWARPSRSCTSDWRDLSSDLT